MNQPLGEGKERGRIVWEPCFGEEKAQCGGEGEGIYRQNLKVN